MIGKEVKQKYSFMKWCGETREFHRKEVNRLTLQLAKHQAKDCEMDSIKK